MFCVGIRDGSPLQRPCICGKVKGQQCAERGLMNHRNFSPYDYLYNVNDINDDCYLDSPDLFTPTRHWALVGEIKECDMMCIQPQVLISTKFGETFPVHFYLHNGQTPSFFKWENLKPGSTICIFYPRRHQFLDLSEGIRQENADTVMVFPVSQEMLTQECCFLADYSPARCFGCGQQEKQLKRCSKCDLAYYCSRDCRQGHWKSSHKKLCAHYRMLSNLLNLDFSKFDGCVDWNFAIKELPNPEAREKWKYQAIGTTPSSKSNRLLQLLKQCEDYILKYDAISKRVFETQLGLVFFQETNLQIQNDASSPLSDNVVFQAMMCLARSFSDSENGHKCFVVDLKSNGQIEDMDNEIFLTTLFLSLPQWQLQEDIKRIYWSFETHHLLDTEPIFPSSLWKLIQDPNRLMVDNQHSFAFYDVDPNMVSNVALRMVEQHPDDFVVRVLRAGGGETYIDLVPELTKSGAPSNMITIWIRGDFTTHGANNDDVRPGGSLVEQLTDYIEL
jgi:hypothetical protein